MLPRKSKPADVTPVVTRAVAGVRRSIGRLVRLLGDQDPAVVQSAADALAGLGARAVVEPLAAALGRPGEPRLRAAVAVVLVALAGEERAPVVLALRRALGREEDPVVSLVLRKALYSAIATDLGPSPQRRWAGPAPGLANS